MVWFGPVGPVDRQEMCSTWTGNLWSPSGLYAKLILAAVLGLTGGRGIALDAAVVRRHDRAMNVEEINIGHWWTLT
jgi:hypothetical protein